MNEMNVAWNQTWWALDAGNSTATDNSDYYRDIFI
jgi:hypothetical protein